MTRSWLGFGLALLLLVSPLRRLWAEVDYGPWSLFVVFALLVGVAGWVSRGQE